jgi:2-polyprenyl-6-methoxyphenol hydroxylase-like FAD-dependent oxidoreductase
MLCTGDAAHALSPVGGVGINLAIQDAVAAANLRSDPLQHDKFPRHLQLVQPRRELPPRITQGLQIAIQKRVISRVLGRIGKLNSPLPLRLLSRMGVLREISGRLIGIDIQPELVTIPDFSAGQNAESSQLVNRP